MHALPSSLAFLLAVELLSPGAPLAAEPPVPAKPPAAAEPPVYEAPEPLQTPPGSKADQALWWRALEVSNEMSTGRAAAAKLQWRARSGNYEKRLAEKAKGLSPEEAERLAALSKKVEATWKANFDLLSSRWPVDPTRGCQYPAQLLESAMHGAPSPAQSGLLESPRRDTRQCVELAETVLRRLAQSNDALAKALAEADAALATKAK
jgi:hypothetical protein